MSVSMHDVRKVLDPDEPDYAAAARLGTDSLPHLRALVAGEDPLLAAKAAYTAGLLEGDSGQDVIAAAARSDDAALRVAAAGAAVNLPPESAAAVLNDLVADPDPGVRKVALTSVPDEPPAELAHRIQQGAAASAQPEEALSGGASTPAPMPGERSGGGRMPGEDSEGGLMPGEESGGSRGMRNAQSPPRPGKMPGEA